MDVVKPLVELNPNGLAPTLIEFTSCPKCKIIEEITILGEYSIGTSIFVDTRKGTIKKAT